MKMKIKYLLTLTFILLFQLGHASDVKKSIQDSGLIWIAILVILIVLLGIFFYLFRMDKKLNKINTDVE